MIISYLAGNSLVSIEIDATIREEHQGTTTITQHNVETGAAVSDHARPEQRKVTADIVITNTPIRVPTTNTDGVSGEFSATDVDVATRVDLPLVLPGIGVAEAIAGNDVLNRTIATSVTVLNFDGPMNRVLSVYNELELLRTSSTVVQLDTALQQYTNMVLQSVTAPRSAGDGSSITFSIVFGEIRFVDSKVVSVSDPGTKTTTKGVQATKKVPDSLRSTFKSTAIKAGLSTATARPLAPLP